MAIKRFFMGDDVKKRPSKIDAAVDEAVRGKKPAPVVKKPTKKPPRY